MTMPTPLPRRRPHAISNPHTALALLASLSLLGCGGGLPEEVTNPPGSGARKLAFAYFQKCVQPLLVVPITSPSGGTNTCASGGCHSNVNGTGGALRLIDTAAVVDLKDPANTAEQVRSTDMYKNYYSAMGVTVPGNPTQSRLLAKPLLLNVLHGGGQILASDQDELAQVITYWINHPVPSVDNEFSTSTYRMFTPADPDTGACNKP